MKKSIVIVGAGLVGCVAALYFARRGYEITLYERRADLRTHGLIQGRSINLALSHRGISALQQLNLSHQVLAEAVPMYGRCVHNKQNELSYQPYSFHPNEFNYAVSRERLNYILLDQLDTYVTVKVKFEHTIELNNLKNIAVEIPWIIADGASSHIRKELTQLRQVNFTETVSEHSYKELTISMQHGFALKKNYLHIWPMHEFMLIALPNLVGSFTCTLFMPTEKFLHLNTSKQIHAFFKDNFSGLNALIPDLVEQFQKNPLGSLKTIDGGPWFVDDQMLFIGDAAHGILPFLGQGMNCGFEDCQLLDALLDHFDDNWHLAFKVFSEQRKIDTDAIAKLSLANYLEMRHKVVDKEYLKKREIEQFLVSTYPKKYRPIYELISYTSIPYAEILKLQLKREKLLQRLLKLKS